MRTASLALLILATGCAAPGVDAPSLAPRAAEQVDPRVPIVDPALPAIPDAALVQRLESLVAQAEAGDRDFEAAAAGARALAGPAGPRESESWVVAQQALSRAVAARAPVTRAMGEIDAIGADRLVAAGGIGAANFAAIKAAAARVAQIDTREADAIRAIQSAIAR